MLTKHWIRQVLFGINEIFNSVLTRIMCQDETILYRSFDTDSGSHWARNGSGTTEQKDPRQYWSWSFQSVKGFFCNFLKHKNTFCFVDHNIRLASMNCWLKETHPVTITLRFSTIMTYLFVASEVTPYLQWIKWAYCFGMRTLDKVFVVKCCLNNKGLFKSRI